jgi:general secretion pathway protein J
MTGHRSSAGFTLMETLVSLIVLGFIIGGLAQGLHFGMSVWDRQVRTIDRDSALDSTNRILRMLLARMAPGDDPHVPAIDGDAVRLSFTAELPVNAPSAPTRLADLTLDGGAGGSLVLRWTPHLHARRLAPAVVQETVLLSGLRQLRFAYYRPPSGHAAAGWVASWQSADPPDLVRVHIAFRDPSKHWPDVIVAPMCEANND